MARVKDYWIYQERRKAIPWALHIFATKEGRSTRCDFDMYAEWIRNKSHKITVKDVSLHNVSRWVHDICADFGMVFTVEDATQIDNELRLLKQDLKG